MALLQHAIVSIPEFFKTGLAKIRAHFTTGQLKAIKSVQRPRDVSLILNNLQLLLCGTCEIIISMD